MISIYLNYAKYQPQKFPSIFTSKALLDINDLFF